MIQYLSKENKKNLRGTALLRLDFNTEDEWRMKAALPTLRFLLKTAEKIVIVSHKGRPRGFEKKLSLAKNAGDLWRFLGKRIYFIPHFKFKEIEKIIACAPKKSVFLLENIRFLKGESTKSPELAKSLANLADYYVNDAFAVSHRGSDSVAKIEGFLPSYAGLELEKELRHLGRITKRPRRPIVIILGGAKAHDKLGVIRHFGDKADAFLLGGAAANTILSLRGVDVGTSVVDKSREDLAMLRKVAHHRNMVLPLDWKTEKKAILDIGEETVSHFEKHIKGAKTIIWNGPMGLIEKKRFTRGTLAIAKAVGRNRKAFSVVGGGETVMFLKKHRLDKHFSFISTGGGAMLDFLAGEKMPGIEALKRK